MNWTPIVGPNPTIGVFFMSKYSQKFKLRVVLDYLGGAKGLTEIARKYGVASKENVYKWAQQYSTFGPDGLVSRRSNAEYDGSFKVKVLKWLKQHGATLNETALHFDISEPSTIWRWQRTFDTSGIEVLYRRRGRATGMTDKKKDTKKRSTKADTDLKKLQEENELLKIENEYLKKLRALIQSQPDDEHKSSKN